jgi:hypothetical protein
MTYYHGTVTDHVVVLGPEFDLVDGTEVLVQPIPSKACAGGPPLKVAPGQAELRNGVPLFPRNPKGKPFGIAAVNLLRDESP